MATSKLNAKGQAEVRTTFAANTSIPRAYVLPDGSWKFSEVHALKAVDGDASQLEVIENKHYVSPTAAPAAGETSEADSDTDA